jgi:hypothetical protein
MSESEGAESAPGRFHPEDLRITTDDGIPAVEFPNGQLLRLRTHVRVEDRYDHPLEGRYVELATEVDTNDFAWWVLYPADEDEEFPELSIEPEFVDPDEKEDR